MTCEKPMLDAMASRLKKKLEPLVIAAKVDLSMGLISGAFWRGDGNYQEAACQPGNVSS